MFLTAVKACCEKFATETGRLQAPAAGGFMYPPEMIPAAQIERADDGSWNVNGCCGGGCYVLCDIKYCPFCGAKLEDGPRTGIHHARGGEL